MGYLNVFRAVMFKNFRTRTHHWAINVFQILLPIVLFALVACIAGTSDCFEKKYVNRTSFGSRLTTEQLYNNKFNHATKIYYAPSTPFASDLIREVQLKFSLTSNAIKGYDSENQMRNGIEYDDDPIIAVVFKNVTSSEIPKRLEYTLRPYEKFVEWHLEMLYNAVEDYVPDLGSEMYVTRGLLAFQMALETSYIEMVSNGSLPIAITVEEFPYPPHVDNKESKNMIKYFLPMITVLSFTLLFPIIISHVMEDKVSGIKELMRVMGLKSAMLWFTWFLDAFYCNFISVISIAAILSYLKIGEHQPLLEHSSFVLVLTFILLYSSVVITFCFLLSSLFNKPIHAATVAMIAWITTFAIPLKYTNEGLQRMFLMFPNAALVFGFKVISEFETREIGVQWSTLFQSASENSEEITMGGILVCFVIHVIFNVIATLYVNELRPGTYENPKIWYFPLEWFKRRRHQQEEDPKTTTYDNYIEKDDLEVSVKLRNVSKLFGTQKAVDDLSIDFYHQQITVLLGKNGAGKTTTLSMIAGLLQPTTGTILIYDSLKRENSVSICPQNNLNFHALSVLHHLRFYGILKGMSADDALSEATVIIVKTNLVDKKNCLPSELSGGMLRRLSVAIAIIGSTKVVILDEPTTGLDPNSRREIWDMLLSLRGYRTFIITTHSMEEAEVLGDRIAIIDNGILKSYGTQLFLRKKLGAGSYINLHLKNPSDAQQLISQNPDENWKTQKVNDTQVRLFLSNMPNSGIKQLLKRLENSEDVYNIQNIRLAKTTMEEIFLRASTLGVNYKQPSSSPPVFQRSNKISAWKKFQILFIKWLKFTRLKMQILQILVMIMCIFICLRDSDSSRSAVTDNDNVLPIELNVYGESAVFIGNSDSGPFPKVADHYGNLVKDSVKYFKRVQNVSDEIVQQGIDNIEFYKKHIIAAVTFNRNNGEKVATALYSNIASHGAPISLNLLSNALVKTLGGEEYAIEGQIRSLPSPSKHRVEHMSMIRVLFMWYFFLPLGSLLLVGVSIFNPHFEYLSKIMHLQQMCGVSKWIYWSSCYVKDLLVYAISIAVIIGTAYIVNLYLNLSILFGTNEIVVLLAILMAFGASAILQSYLFTYKTSAFAGHGLFLTTSLLISNSMVIGTFYLEFSGDDDQVEIAKILNRVFLLFPTYGLNYTVMQLIRQSVWNHNWSVKSFEHKQAICASNYNPCCDSDNSTECIRHQSYFFGADPMITNLSEMLSSSFLYFIILVIMEAKLSFRMCKKRKRKENLKGDIEKGETDSLISNGSLHVNIESKKFGSQVVLDQINFEIASKECVALLGVNGAGKSTTLRLLTGEEDLDDGYISLDEDDKQLSIGKNKLEYCQNFGYCPQFDELSDLTSGRTLLRLFADLRGIKKAEDDVEGFLKIFGLEKLANQPCNTYSIGCKRKLFTAFALIGMPSFIILDEPTAGVDVESRKKLWDALAVTKNSDASVILSTHNMDECEALCERVLTLKNGRLIFNGSLNELKSQYSESCATTLKLIPTNKDLPLDKIKDLKIAFEKYFNKHKLLDEHATLLKYIVEKNEKRLSSIFEVVEKLQSKHSIVKDFDISEVTLETLFLNVNKEYSEKQPKTTLTYANGTHQNASTSKIMKACEQGHIYNTQYLKEKSWGSYKCFI